MLYLVCTYHHQYHLRRSSRRVGFAGSYHRLQTKSCVVHCSATSLNRLPPLRALECCPTQRRLVLMVRVIYLRTRHIAAPSATDPIVRWPNETAVVPNDCPVFLLIIHSSYTRSPITRRRVCMWLQLCSALGDNNNFNLAKGNYAHLVIYHCI